MIRTAALSLMLLAGCGSEDGRHDGGVGPADTRTDGALEPDGPWSCTGPATGGGAVACTFTWKCADGDRTLSCGYDVVYNVYDCECQNIAKGKIEGTFSGPSQTCASGAPTVVTQANTACKWKLPGG